MDSYNETSREDYTGENAAENAGGNMVPEIPVAAPAAAGKETLLPKKEGADDELIIKYRKPFEFEGETFTELDLHGTTTYAKIVATKVTGLPAEYFEDLPVGEIEKIKNAVVGFFYKDE